MNPPTELREDAPIRTDQKTLVWLLGLAVSLTLGIAFAWSNVKAATEDTARKVAALESAQSADHDKVVTSAAHVENLAKTVENIDRKLDRVLERVGASPAIATSLP